MPRSAVNEEIRL